MNFRLAAESLLNTLPDNALAMTALKRIFLANYANSLPKEQIEGPLSIEQFGCTLEMRYALNKAVRAKVLRSRMIGGVRHYEINFKE